MRRPGLALMVIRPFRPLRHSASDAGLDGSRATPGPGEISLAQEGILFLVEIPELNRETLEVLRQPLAEGRHHQAGGAEHKLSCLVHPGGDDELVPVRLPLRPQARLELHAAAGRELPRSVAS